MKARGEGPPGSLELGVLLRIPGKQHFGVLARGARGEDKKPLWYAGAASQLTAPRPEPRPVCVWVSGLSLPQGGPRDQRLSLPKGGRVPMLRHGTHLGMGSK